MNVTNRPIPPGVELIRLRTTVKYALEVIRDVERYAETAADVCRRVDPIYAEGLDNLRRELQAAQEAMRTGSPAAVMFCLDALVGGVTP